MQIVQYKWRMDKQDSDGKYSWCSDVDSSLPVVYIWLDRIKKDTV